MEFDIKSLSAVQYNLPRKVYGSFHAIVLEVQCVYHGATSIQNL